MIFDTAQMRFSSAQAITVDAISENVIQWNAMGTVYDHAAALTRDIGDGTPVPLLIQVVTAFATLTSLTITLESADNAALSTNAVVHWSSGAIAVADLVAGKQIPIRFLPKDIEKLYLGLRYDVTGTTATAGAITAGIVAGIQS